MSSDIETKKRRILSLDYDNRVTKPIRRVPQEELPGIQPLLFREIDHRIAQTLLHHQPLPDSFLMCEDREAEGALLFKGKRYDLNITLFAIRKEVQRSECMNGVFVISNGAGVLTNTVDELSDSVNIAGMIDLKQNFHEDKIADAFEMARFVRPDLDALVVNMISGIALTQDAAAAIERFCVSVDGKVPVILRFSGPDSHENWNLMLDLRQRHDSVILADSTHDLVGKTIRLFGLRPSAMPPINTMTDRVEAALFERARLGVTVDPGAWLTPDRTVEHVFGSKATTRVGVLGFGGTARFQTRAMVEAGVQVCWAVTPTAAKHADSGIMGVEVYPTVDQAVVANGDVDIVVNYAPAAYVYDAAKDYLGDSSQASLMILVAEDTPYETAISVMDILEERETVCIGPNSPGVMIVGENDGKPDLFKLGNMPSSLFSINGGMSVVGRSGTVIFDIIEQAAAAGIGTRMGWAIGGDKYTGLGFLESMVVFEQDPKTKFIVINGESGGIQEQFVARLTATGIISKPVIALVTGEALPVGVQWGHKGAVKFAESDDPRIKKQRLTAAGVIVVDNPTEVVKAIQEIDRVGWDIDARRQEALWERLVDAGKEHGLRWNNNLRTAYDLIYGMVGYYRIYYAHEHTIHHLYELMTHLVAVGVDRLLDLFSTTIRPDAFVMAFEKSREYVAELLRSVHEIGIENFKRLVTAVFGEDSFNEALGATPWAAADIINEAHEIGITETQNVVEKTMGTVLFRETLARKPWNTAHAFRTINNMRWWRYVRAYDRYCTHLAGDSQIPKASWRRNPWASVKLVRFYENMPDGELEQALDDPLSWKLFLEKSQKDPQGLVDFENRVSWKSLVSERPFHEVFSEQVGEGVPNRPMIESEIQRMGADDFGDLIDTVFTSLAFERSKKDHEDSTARALQTVNDLGDGQSSGAQKIIEIYRNHIDVFDTPAFRLGVARNLWMVVDLLCAMDRIDPISSQRIIDYVISQTAFNYVISEHQWGTGQALEKIADMGAKKFLDTHRIIEDVTRDRECFKESLKKNPRDAVEIVQVAALLEVKDLGEFMADPETREAFLARMRICPRNAAHFLAEIAVMSVKAFNEFVDNDFGRHLLNDMLSSKGCNLVRSMRRINMVGIDAFQQELRAWMVDDPEHVLTPENATYVVGILRERALERRFTDLDRTIKVNLRGQRSFNMTEGEILGLYQSFPEWGDVLFKLQGGQPTTTAERFDLYRLISGHKRFQKHMVPVLTNFIPLPTIRSRIAEGKPLFHEIRALRGVTQRAPHRFDVYFHTLAVLDQLEESVLPLDFLPATVSHKVKSALDEKIGQVSRHNLLILAAALHDLGKASGTSEDIQADHAELGVKAVAPILDRFGLSGIQKELVIAVIRYHAPSKIRKPNEPFEDFKKRGGLDLLYEKITDNDNNPYPIETILHYHADILGRQGDATSGIQVERRKQVTDYLLGRFMKEHPNKTSLDPANAGEEESADSADSED